MSSLSKVAQNSTHLYLVLVGHSKAGLSRYSNSFLGDTNELGSVSLHLCFSV